MAQLRCPAWTDGHANVWERATCCRQLAEGERDPECDRTCSGWSPTGQEPPRGHAVPPSLSETTHGPWHEMSNGLLIAATFQPKREMTEETIHMKAIIVTDQAAGTAGMKLVERPEPPAAINDVIVQIHASGFVPTELTWPSTWTDRRDRDRTPSIPGHEL